MRVIIVLFLLISLTIASDKVDNSGLAVFCGYGERFGGLGLEVEYQIKKLGGLLTLTPFLSGGRYLSPLEDYIGYSVGFNVEAGHKHRGLLGILYGTIDEEYEKSRELFSGSTYYEGNNLIVGPAFIVGYKGMSSFGLSWTVSTGYGLHLNSKKGFIRNVFKNDDVTSVMFSAGIGFKI
jgi:hypothetical protein